MPTYPTAPTISTLVEEGLLQAGYINPTSSLTARATTEWIEEVKADISLVEKRLTTLMASASGTTTVSGSGVYSLAVDFGEEIAIRFSGIIDPLKLVTKERHNEQHASPVYGVPDHYAIVESSGVKQVEFFPYPDAAYSWSYDYYADLALIDTAGTMMAACYRQWRVLFIQGVKAKCLQWNDDNRASAEMTVYWNLVKSVVGRDSIAASRTLQATVEDYG